MLARTAADVRRRCAASSSWSTRLDCADSRARHQVGGAGLRRRGIAFDRAADAAPDVDLPAQRPADAELADRIPGASRSRCVPAPRLPPELLCVAEPCSPPSDRARLALRGSARRPGDRPPRRSAGSGWRRRPARRADRASDRRTCSTTCRDRSRRAAWPGGTEPSAGLLELRRRRRGRLAAARSRDRPGSPTATAARRRQQRPRCHHARACVPPMARARPAVAVAVAPTEAVEIDVDHRRRIERQDLADDQAADDRDAERLAQLRAVAEAERQRQRAQHRRHGRHQDRPEAQQAGLVDRLARARGRRCVRAPAPRRSS